MNEPAAMFDHLINLTCSFEGPDPWVVADLEALTLGLAASVSCYRGLELTVFSNGYPVVLSVLAPPPGADQGSGRDGAECMTSLRVPLTLLGNQFEIGTQVVFYARCQGALGALAADLARALATRVTTAAPLRPEEHGSEDRGDNHPGCGGSGHGCQEPGADTGPAESTRPVIVLDGDCAPAASGSRVSGLVELRDLNRAAGMMIASGHLPGEVHAGLRREAAAAGLTPHAYALGLLAH